MENNNLEHTIFCSCGCNDGVILKYDKDKFGANMSLVSDNFYFMQITTWERFKEKIKRIWRIIRNKEYSYFDICIEPNEIEAFKRFVEQM